MSFGTGFILVIFIICITIIISLYLMFCADSEVGIFENRGKKYDKQLEELTSEIKEIKEWIKNFIEKDKGQGE